MKDEYYKPLLKDNYYHIYNRGSNNALIFFEDKNYEYFLSKLNYYLSPYLDFYAYCLLPNHFHLLVKVKKEILEVKSDIRIKTISVSKAFSNFFNCYTKSINEAYNKSGNLFQRPFKRKPVYRDDYFQSLICYIHRNPLHHGISDNINNYMWSSYYQIVDQRRQIINISDLRELFGNIENFVEIHEQLILDYNMFMRDFE
jgi:REP element-mobilizing transposase RayT